MMLSAGVLVPRNFHDLCGDFNQKLNIPYVRLKACVGIADVVRSFAIILTSLLCLLGCVYYVCERPVFS